MQAIQSIESAAMEIPRRSSPFRALVWKEWRQQRWIFFSLAGLTYAVLASALIVNRYGSFFHDLRNEAASVLGGCALLLGIASVVVLSANAFSGEGEDNTDQFLATIPCSRSKLFQVKLGFVLFLVLLGVSPLGAAALVQQPHDFVNDFKESALVLAADGFVLAIVPALVASFGGSVIATILASVPVVAACWAYIYSPVVVVLFVPLGSEKGEAELEVLYPILLLATILLAAWRMWIRVERAWLSSLRTAAATAGLLIAYFALPSAAAYFYLTSSAPLSYFLRSNNRIAGAYVDVLSPNGKYVICGAHYSGWRAARSRVALLDADSGRSQWMTRFYYSGVVPMQRFWSPEGNQFILEEADAGLWPLGSGEGNFKFFVVDARSGEKHSFEELWPMVKTLPPLPVWTELVGWYSEDVFAISDGRDIMFADVKSHNVQRCAMPRSLPGGRIGGSSSWSLPITDRGIFAMAKAESLQVAMRVLRFAPELSEAEVLTLPGLNDMAYLGSFRASRDGRHLIINVQQVYPKVEEYIARLDDRIELILLQSSRREAEGLISSSWVDHGFLPESHRILLTGTKEIALFDVDSRVLRRIPLKMEEGVWQITSTELSPRGGFVIVRLTKATGEARSVIVDLCLGTSWASNAGFTWLGEDHLLSLGLGSNVIMNRDGTGERPLLAN